MYDQNPLLQKVTIDQLASLYLPSPVVEPIANARLPGRAVVMTIAALVFAVSVFGLGIT